MRGTTFEQLFYTPGVIIISGPVSGSQKRVVCLIVCLCAIIEQALDNFQPFILAIFGFALCVVATEARAHQRSELPFVSPINPLNLFQVEVFIHFFDDVLNTLHMAVIGGKVQR